MRPVLLIIGVLAISGPSLASEETPTGAKATPTATPGSKKTVGLENTLRWKTASELNNVGFDVYRSNEEKGTFVRLTAKPIAGAGTTDETTQYVFVDDTIEPEKTYWYYVESISMKGEREKFTPTFMAPVKRLPTPPATTPKKPAP